MSTKANASGKQLRNAKTKNAAPKAKPASAKKAAEALAKKTTAPRPKSRKAERTEHRQTSRGISADAFREVLLYLHEQNVLTNPDDIGRYLKRADNEVGRLLAAVQYRIAESLQPAFDDETIFSTTIRTILRREKSTNPKTVEWRKERGAIRNPYSYFNTILFTKLKKYVARTLRARSTAMPKPSPDAGPTGGQPPPPTVRLPDVPFSQLDGRGSDEDHVSFAAQIVDRLGERTDDDTRDDAAEVHQRVARLPAYSRSVFLLRTEGLTYTQVAEQSGIPGAAELDAPALDSPAAAYRVRRVYHGALSALTLSYRLCPACRNELPDKPAHPAECPLPACGEPLALIWPRAEALIPAPEAPEHG